MDRKLIILIIAFMFSCSNNLNKIEVWVDESEKINDFVEAISADFELNTKDYKIEIIKFKDTNELKSLINLPLNNPDLIITNTQNINYLNTKELIKPIVNTDDLANIVNSKILETVRVDDKIIAIPFSVSKKLLVYLNKNLIDINSLTTLSDIDSICESYQKTCFDVFPDFDFANLIYSNNNNKDLSMNFFNKNISKGLVTGVININDARLRFLEGSVPFLFDYDSQFSIYKERLEDNLKIFKMPIDDINKNYIRTQNGSLAVSIYSGSKVNEEVLNVFARSFLSPENQNYLINKINKLPVLSSLLNENNLNNELLIISYRQFELSSILNNQEKLDINSIFTDK